ncbi:MAG: GTPase HflX [Acidobacteriota bacterium]
MYTLEDKGPSVPKKAFIVGVALDGQSVDEVEEHLDELEALIISCGGSVVGRALQRRRVPDAGTFIGSGKAKEIGEAAKALESEIIIFDDDLTASQVKKLEKTSDSAVMDRSSVILEIFARRARTREARTQVELARLNYLLPRLTRRWSHLSRQVGGIGVRGGEGESQLEADRRMLRQRIQRLKKELKKIEKTRGVQRHSRRDVPVVALAGYTNAGKSTLFNRLTGGDVYAKNQLFATLDSRLRRGALAPQRMVIFADTVGFIRKLPHHLVSSFRSTLEEITEADLVLHVIDRSHPAWREQYQVAREVLEDLGVSSEETLLVYNKIDLLGDASPFLPGEHGSDTTLAVSATTGEGLDTLKATLAQRLFQGDQVSFGPPPSALPQSDSDSP